MELTIDELRESYKSFSDDKLIRLATTEVEGLRPEAIQVMKEEIKRRGLSNAFLAGIEVQTKEISDDELLAYCEFLRRVPYAILRQPSLMQQ